MEIPRLRELVCGRPDGGSRLEGPCCTTSSRQLSHCRFFGSSNNIRDVQVFKFQVFYKNLTLVFEENLKQASNMLTRPNQTIGFIVVSSIQIWYACRLLLFRCYCFVIRCTLPLSKPSTLFYKKQGLQLCLSLDTVQ